MSKYFNKKSYHIGKNVSIGKNVTIYPGNFIDGQCKIGDNVTLFPDNYIIDSVIENDVTIHSSVIEKSVIRAKTSVGPFARLRPGAEIGSNCKIGNFVEIKNSKIGDKTKISHLAYVGDSEIGCECNIGCGVIFANYNGKTKNKIKIGNHVFVGSNCNLIAPLTIKNDSYICAGTTVTEDVERNDFVIGRCKQINKPGRGKNYF